MAVFENVQLDLHLPVPVGLRPKNARQPRERRLYNQLATSILGTVSSTVIPAILSPATKGPPLLKKLLPARHTPIARCDVYLWRCVIIWPPLSLQGRRWAKLIYVSQEMVTTMGTGLEQLQLCLARSIEP